MIDLSKLTTDNLIQIVGVILTLIVIGVSINQFGKTISHSLVEAKQKTALEQTSELPLLVAELCSSASDVAAGITLGEDNLTKGQLLDFEKSKKVQNEILPLIKNNILSYGSNDAIKIFIKFDEAIFNSNDEGISVEAYYILPLLLTQIKMDVIGEVVDPLVFFKSFMPQFKNHTDKAGEHINKVIDDLELNKVMKVK